MYTFFPRHFNCIILLFLISTTTHSQSNHKVDLDRILACTPEEPEIPNVSVRYKVTVTHIVDGDTFFAKDSLGNRKKYRLIGIDTPEFSHFGRPEEPYAQEATDYLTFLIKKGTALGTPSEVEPVISREVENLVISSKVEISYDLQPKDKYHRDLVYLYLPDSTFVNAELVRAGWAHVSTISPNITHAHTFIKLQRQARQQGRGLWKKDH